LQTTSATSATTTTRRRRRLCLLEQNLQRTQQEGENDEESRRDDAHLRRALVRARFKAARGVKIFGERVRVFFCFWFDDDVSCQQMRARDFDFALY
jgi:hypothetical protein